MKSKRTNILLGIIAINLTLLTLIQLEIWPTKANANELELNSGEKENFNISINAVKELFLSAKKIDPDLK